MCLFTFSLLLSAFLFSVVLWILSQACLNAWIKAPINYWCNRQIWPCYFILSWVKILNVVLGWGITICHLISLCYTLDLSVDLIMLRPSNELWSWNHPLSVPILTVKPKKVMGVNKYKHIYTHLLFCVKIIFMTFESSLWLLSQCQNVLAFKLAIV